MVGEDGDGWWVGAFPSLFLALNNSMAACLFAESSVTVSRGYAAVAACFSILVKRAVARRDEMRRWCPRMPPPLHCFLASFSSWPASGFAPTRLQCLKI
jgi:hypothetical protein